MLSAVVITKNEEKNIIDCIKDLSWCDEIIIIDDYSLDKTIEKAQNSKLKTQNYNLKVKIFQRHLNNDFASQRNFGLDKATGDWVLFIDADERISAALGEEIVSSIQHPASKINGFYLRRKDKFLGKWLKFGETASVGLLRLAKKKVGKWEGQVHEIWQVKGNIGNLENPLIHERNITISQFLQRINQYSTIRAAQLYQQGVKTNIFLVIVFPLGKFLVNYIFRLGFLDGIPGLIMAGMMSLHSFMVRSKLWVMGKNNGREEFSVNWQEYAE